MNMTGELLRAIGEPGGRYALCGVAVWLGLRLTGQVNLGLAGCAGLAALALGLTPLPAVLAGCGLGAAAGCGLELGVMRRVGVGAGSVLAGLVSWLALAGLADAVARLLPVPHAAGLGSYWLWAGLAVAAACVAWIERPGRGRLALRAAAADPVAAALGGVPVNRMRLAIAAVSGALVGLAAVLGGGAAWVLVLHGVAAALVGQRWGVGGVVGAALGLAVLERLAGPGELLGYAVLLAVLLLPSRAAARAA
jgi:hypothetical protein